MVRFNLPFYNFAIVGLPPLARTEAGAILEKTQGIGKSSRFVSHQSLVYGHIVFNIIFSSATETERKVKNRVRFGEILVRKAFDA